MFRESFAAAKQPAGVRGEVRKGLLKERKGEKRLLWLIQMPGLQGIPYRSWSPAALCQRSQTGFLKQNANFSPTNQP
jgi:hypothetical protein